MVQLTVSNVSACCSCHTAVASKSRKGRSSNRKTRSQTSLGTDTDDTEAASLQQIEKERKQLELENEERKKQLEMLKEEERSTQAALSTGGSCLHYVASWQTTSTQTIAHNICFIKNMLNIHIYNKILDVVLVLLWAVIIFGCSTITKYAKTSE